MKSRLLNMAATRKADVDQIEAAHGVSATALVQHVSVADIQRSPAQPRYSIQRDEEFAALVATIQEQGLIHPISVRQLVSGAYELLAGERRLRACESLGMTTIPAYVHLYVTDAKARAMTITENLARSDLYPLEEARAIGSLRDHRLAEGLAVDVRSLEPLTGRKKTSISDLLTINDGITDDVLENVIAQYGEAAGEAVRCGSKAELLKAAKHENAMDRVRALILQCEPVHPSSLPTNDQVATPEGCDPGGARAEFSISWSDKKRLRVSTAVPVSRMSPENADELVAALRPVITYLEERARSRAS